MCRVQKTEGFKKGHLCLSNPPHPRPLVPTETKIQTSLLISVATVTFWVKTRDPEGGRANLRLDGPVLKGRCLCFINRVCEYKGIFSYNEDQYIILY